MFHTAVLIIPIDIKPDDIRLVLTNAGNYASDKIFVHIHSDYNVSHKSLPKLSPLAIKIYEESVTSLPETDVRVQVINFRETKELPLVKYEVDVILIGIEKPSQELRSRYVRMYRCSDVINVGEDIGTEQNMSQEAGEMYDTVVLGGTFDRLHVGHKILLTESVLRSRKRVVVGVTDENMIRKGVVDRF